VPALRRAIRAVLPTRLRDLEALAPRIPAVQSGSLAPEPVTGQVTAQANFFAGCVATVTLPNVDTATLKVLGRCGCQVAMPEGQTCCGALHAHQGDIEFAQKLARQNIDAFAGDDVIVTNSAGCGAMLKEYGHLLAEDPEYKERAADFARRTKDISEYLDQIGPLSPTQELNVTVAIQDPCHLGNVQRIRQQPRRLLKSIKGLVLMEPTDGEICCGAAGIYNLTQPETAAALLERKVSHLLKTGATVVATANPGCHLHLLRRLEEHGVRVAHVVELLEEATRP